MSLSQLETATRLDDLAGDPASIVRGEKGYCARDVFGRAEPAQRGLAFHAAHACGILPGFGTPVNMSYNRIGHWERIGNPMSATPTLLSRVPVDYLPGDTTIAARASAFYHDLNTALSARKGYSSRAAGWPQEIVVERWSLPPLVWPDHTMQKHRVGVIMSSTPRVCTWTDGDGRWRKGTYMPGSINVMPQGLTTRARWTEQVELATFEFRLSSSAASSAQGLRLLSNSLKPAASTMSLLMTSPRGLRLSWSHPPSSCMARCSASPWSCISCGDTGREVGLSEAYFARAFRATFQEPPHRLVLRWRLERAARLITKTGCSLADAATAAGFCDQAHLTNAMRRHFGKTPSALRWNMQ